METTKAAIATPLAAARHFYAELRARGHSPLSLHKSYHKRNNRHYRAQIAGLSQGHWATANGKTPTDCITVTRIGEEECYFTISLARLEAEYANSQQLELPLAAKGLYHRDPLERWKHIRHRLKTPLKGAPYAID